MTRGFPPTETTKTGVDHGRVYEGILQQYTPALRFRFLTRFFDTLLPVVVPERRFRAALIEGASIAPGAKVWIWAAGPEPCC